MVFGVLIASAILCLSPVFGFGAIKAMYPYSWCFANWNARESKDMVRSRVGEVTLKGSYPKGSFPLGAWNGLFFVCFIDPFCLLNARLDFML